MSWVRVAWFKCTLLYVSYMLVQISFFISSTYIVFVFIDPKISTPMNQGRVPHNNLSFHRCIPPSYHNFIKWRPSTPFLDPVDPGTLWLWSSRTAGEPGAALPPATLSSTNSANTSQPAWIPSQPALFSSSERADIHSYSKVLPMLILCKVVRQNFLRTIYFSGTQKFLKDSSCNPLF